MFSFSILALSGFNVSYSIFFSSFSRSGCIGDHYPIFFILGNAGIYVVTCSSPRVRRTTVLFLSALCTRNEAIFIQYFILSHLLYPLVILCCYPLLAFCNYFWCSSAPTQLAWNAEQCTLFFPESAVTASCPNNVRLYSFEWVVLGFERVIWKGGVVRDTVQLLNIHERNVFTVPRITLRQIGQSDRDFAHASQQTKWPHGRKTVLVSRSMHTLHVLASRSLRFFSSSDAASSAVPSVSGLSVIVTEVATLDDALSSETCTHTTWT